MQDRAHDRSLLARRAQRWRAQRTFGAADLPHAELRALKRDRRVTVSVALPALNEAGTVGEICRQVASELMSGIVDELVVIDGGSSDLTAERARAAGATVHALGELPPDLPVVPGKGESLWRSLSVLSGDLVVWVDADIRNFQPHFVTRLLTPLLLDEEIGFVKAFYRRPLVHGDVVLPTGGGRVTELLARPLLGALFPELAGLLQPLAGEYAARRTLLDTVPFLSGYSVDVGLLIDVLSVAGLDAIAQVDLGERVHRNRSLEELTPMAHAITRTILRRAEAWGRLRALEDHAGGESHTEIERPPHATLSAFEAPA